MNLLQFRNARDILKKHKSRERLDLSPFL